MENQDVGARANFRCWFPGLRETAGKALFLGVCVFLKDTCVDILGLSKASSNQLGFWMEEKGKET